MSFDRLMIAVDMHIFHVSERTKLSFGKNVEQAEATESCQCVLEDLYES